MHGKITKTIAAMLVSASMIASVPASARPNHDNGWSRHDDRNRHSDRWDRRDDRRDRHHDRRWNRYGGSYGYNGYRGSWRVGHRYPHWREDRYYIRDYSAYGLPAPWRGYRYYRTDSGDIVMVAIASGLIGMILGQAIAR